MASSSGYNGAGGVAQNSSCKLQATDLPSKRLLGKGLTAIVYETEWKRLRCARKDFMGVPSDIFEAEASTLVRLEHDNIVKTHGWTVDKMSCSLVEEYVEDDSLGFLQRRKRSQGSSVDSCLELQEPIEVMLQTARAMAYLHEHGIIHGDLKTNNIFVTQVNDEGKNSLLVKVADFGLIRTKKMSIPFVSRSVRKLDMVQWNGPEYIKNSLDHASEGTEESFESDSSSNESDSGSSDLQNDRQQFQACDMYSFALTCYQILTGKKPYPNWNWRALGAQIVQDDLRPKLPASCPISLRDLLVQCWDKDQTKRPTFTNICRTLLEIQLTISKSIDHLHPIMRVLDDSSSDVVPTHNLSKASVSMNFNTEIRNKSHDGHEANTSMGSLMKIEANVDHGEQSHEVGCLSGSSSESSKVQESTTFHNASSKKKKVGVKVSQSLHHFLSRLSCFGTPSASKHWELISKGLFTLTCEVEAYMTSEIVRVPTKLRSIFLKSETSEISISKNDVEKENYEVFLSLQCDPMYGRFFQTFGYALRWPMLGELEIGKKFAEGGQAEMFHVKVHWCKQEMMERDLKENCEWVLKIFKKGTMLHDLKSQIPLGMLQFYGNLLINLIETSSPEASPRNISMIESFRPEAFPRGISMIMSPISEASPRNISMIESFTPEEYPRNISMPRCATLLKDGRFAFLVRRESCDLRILIDHCILRGEGGMEGGPFKRKDVEVIMWDIACGLGWLHRHGIVHRDVKASNVLVNLHNDHSFHCLIADFECSAGVVGAGFFRAPEILQACREKNVSRRPELFSEASDVYSYGMTCYEVLTGKVPFQGHPIYDYDFVLLGGRPIVPKYVHYWIRKLLSRCWDSDPTCRPTFREILEVISKNSMTNSMTISETINRRKNPSIENRWGLQAIRH